MGTPYVFIKNWLSTMKSLNTKNMIEERVNHKEMTTKR